MGLAETDGWTDPSLGVLKAIKSHSREALTQRSHSQIASKDYKECVVAGRNNGGVVSEDFFLLENCPYFHFLLVIVWEKKYVNFGEPGFPSISATHGFRAKKNYP